MWVWGRGRGDSQGEGSAGRICVEVVYHAAHGSPIVVHAELVEGREHFGRRNRTARVRIQRLQRIRTGRCPSGREGTGTHSLEPRGRSAQRGFAFVRRTFRRTARAGSAASRASNSRRASAAMTPSHFAAQRAAQRRHRYTVAGRTLRDHETQNQAHCASAFCFRDGFRIRNSRSREIFHTFIIDPNLLSAMHGDAAAPYTYTPRSTSRATGGACRGSDRIGSRTRRCARQPINDRIVPARRARRTSPWR